MPDHIQVGDAVPRVQYVANGSQTAFTFLFPVFTAADMEVWLDGVKQSPPAYSISGTGISAGGTVLLAVPPGNGVLVTLRRRLAIARTSDYQEDGIIRAKVLNDELDYQTAALQQVADDAGRAVKRSFLGASAVDLTLPEPIAGKAIGWNAAGDALTNDPAEFAATVATVTAQAAATATSATAAATSASTASTQAGIATTKAGEASTSADAAATSAASMTASVAACAASETAAASSAATASTQAGNAATSATSAAGSAGTATTQATNAGTSETNAAAAASSASASATTATTKAAEAAASAASLPNSSVGTGKVPRWNGTAWVGTDVGIGDLVAANNLSDLGDAAAARGNLGAAAASHGHASADVSDFVEATQDVVGAMVAAAGGSYNDSAGTIAFPAGGGGALEYVASVATTSGTYAQITGLEAGYDYIFDFDNVKPASGDFFACQVGTGGTPTWMSAGYNHAHAIISEGVALTRYTATNAGWIGLGSDGRYTNAAYGGVSGSLVLSNPAGGYAKAIYDVSHSAEASHNIDRVTGSGYYRGASTAITAIRFFFYNLVSLNGGSIHVYKRAKA